MLSIIEIFLILATVLSLVGAGLSIYYSYNKVKKNKNLKVEDNNNINRALIALSDYKESSNNTDYKDLARLGNVIRAERQESLFKFISLNNSIPNSIANAALKEICAFTKDKSPDYIMGINRGGTMVAAIASLQLNMPSSNFLRCYVDNKEVYFPNDNISGSILIIDDISRTGSTLVRLKNYIHQNFAGVNVITATLFMYMENEYPIFREVSYYSYKINSQNAKLPWNNIETTKEQQFKSIRDSSISELASDLELQIAD